MVQQKLHASALDVLCLLLHGGERRLFAQVIHRLSAGNDFPELLPLSQSSGGPFVLIPIGHDRVPLLVVTDTGTRVTDRGTRGTRAAGTNGADFAQLC